MNQMNMQCSLIQELMVYEIRRCHNAIETSKDIYCAKEEGTVDYSTKTKWFKKSHLGCKNLNDQAKSSRPKTMDSEAVSQVIHANQVSSSQRVLCKLSISQSSVVSYLHDLSTSIHSCQIVSQVIEILQNLWLTLVLLVQILHYNLLYKTAKIK